MSMFIHRCTACGHSDLQHVDLPHAGRACSYVHCPCRDQGAALDPTPELIPLFDLRGRRIETVKRPGERFGAKFFGDLICACNACQEAYSALVGESA